MEDSYSNLEIIKLAIAFATPIVVLVLGMWAKNIALDYEKRASLSNRIIEKRVETYEKIAQDLNDIYVFLQQVGSWKAFSPQQIIEKKRHVDSIMYKTRPYWSDNAFRSYNQFMAASFETFTTVGENAKIKASPTKFKTLNSWQEDWIHAFATQPSEAGVLKKHYQQLMTHLSEEFGYYQKR